MPAQLPIFTKKHPKEMYLLALTEMCQRFAYWGIGNLLVLFLIKHFSYSDPKATHFYAVYTGIAFLLPILGGYIADRWNYRHPIILGICLTSLGSLGFSTLNPALILPSLLLIGLGGGLFTPSIYSLLGLIYKKKQYIREGGFTLYYALVNVGVLVALFLLGYIQTVSWRAVFILTTIVPLFGLIPCSFALKRLRKMKIQSHYFISKKNDPNHYPLKRHEIDRIVVVLVMTLISILFWMAYNQAASSMPIFALNFTDRAVLGFEIPAPWFQGVEPLFIIILAFPLTYLYFYLKRIRSSASPPMKTALSLFFMGLCFLVMQRAASHIPMGATSSAQSPFYLFFAFTLMALGELFIAPIGLSLVTNLSPHRYRGLLTGVWFACIGIGFYLGGYLASFMNTIGLASYFDIYVFTSFVPAFILILFSKKLDTMRHTGYL